MTQSPDSRHDQPPAPLHRRQVLVVEDEEPLRLLFREILAAQAVEMSEASTGEGALAQLQQHAFDLVFLDCKLPDMDGLDILRHAREWQINPDQKVVIMTGHGDSQHAIEAMQLGAVEYLTKPFDLQRIHKILRLHLLGGFIEVDQDVLLLPDAATQTKEQFTDAYVLVVDDDETLLKMMHQLLKHMGAHVLTACDVRSAQDVMRRIPCDVVLTDVRMSNNESAGLDLLQWTKQEYPLTEVIMITSFPSMEVILRALRCGACDFVQRPCPSLDALLVIVERALRLHATAVTGQRAIEALERKNFELGLLYKVYNTISYTTDHETLINIILQSLQQVIPFDIASALMLKPTPSINVYLAGDLPTASIEHAKHQLMAAFHSLGDQSLTINQCKCNLVQLKNDRVATQQDVSQPIPASAEHTFFNVPLLAEEGPIGMLGVWSIHGRKYRDDEVKLVSILARHIAVAIDRVQHIILSEQNKMESMVRSMSEGVIMVDVRGVVVVCNARAKQLLRLSSASVLRESNIQEALTAVGITLPTAEQLHDVQEVASKHGEITQYLRVEQILVHSHDDTKRLIGRAIIITDISKEKEVANLKDDFIATVSHELRTPLTAMKEAVELVADGTAGPATSQQIRFLDIATSNMRRLSLLVKDLLDISKIESGKMVLRLTAVDLQALLQELEQSYQAMAGQRQFTVRCGELPPVFADKERVMQVLTNLIGNAIKYTPEEGSITIGAHRVNGLVECVVQDTGPGIPADRLPELFQKFQQVGTPIQKANMHGTGLGLALCRQLVEQHHGWIKAESTVGQGSTFTFALPVYTKEAAIDRHVEALRAQARRDDEPWGVVVLRFTGEQVWTPELQSVLQRSIHHRDLTCVYAPDTLLIFACSDAAGLKALQQRVMTLMRKVLPDGAQEAGLAGGIVLDPGQVSADQLAQQAIAAVRAPHEDTAPSHQEIQGGHHT